MDSGGCLPDRLRFPIERRGRDRSPLAAALGLWADIVEVEFERRDRVDQTECIDSLHPPPIDTEGYFDSVHVARHGITGLRRADAARDLRETWHRAHRSFPNVPVSPVPPHVVLEPPGHSDIR